MQTAKSEKKTGTERTEKEKNILQKETDRNETKRNENIVAAFRGMHVSPAKHSYA